jgi:hypothetical protein
MTGVASSRVKYFSRWRAKATVGPKLAKNLKAEIDENLIEIYRGTTSLPFEAGKHECAAVKIIDARGIESFKVIRLA